jgi:hypothetical protein
MKWRPVLEGVATLAEIDQFWSLKDLLDCHEALDLRNAARAFYAERAAEKTRAALNQGR